MPGAERTAIGITGNKGEVERGNLESLPGVSEVIRVTKAYKLASRDVKEEDTIVRFAGRMRRSAAEPRRGGRAVFN